MRTRVLACILATTFAAASLPTRVLLAEMDADTKEAKSLFEEGVKLFKGGKFEQARVKFKAAYGLKRRPSIVINLARSELETKRPLDASTHFREVMAMPDAKQDDKEEAKTGLSDARKQLGVVMIDAPANSTVSVDGEARGSVSYSEGIDVAPGSRTIVITGSDGKQTTEKVNVVAGQTVTIKHKASAEPPVVVVPPPSPSPSPPVTEPAAGSPPSTPSPPSPDSTPTTLTAPSDSTSTVDRPQQSKGFFASIHPVTYVTTVATLGSAAAWVAFAISSKNRADNAKTYSDYIASHPTSTKLSQYRTDGRAEADASNSQAKTALVFGVVTGVFAAATVVTFIVLRDKGTTVALSASPTYGGAAFSLSGAF
ncbi:MAG: hypothetical protein NVS3B20_04520 [Polyangiales bacterium]